MNDNDRRTARNICITIIFSLTVLVGGCNVGCYLDDVHEQRMSEKGYHQVPKIVEGEDGVKWTWEKNPVDPPVIIMGGPGFPSAPPFQPKIECVPHPSEVEI